MNRPIDDKSITTRKPFIDCYRLAQQPRHTHYLSDHPPFLGSPWDEIVKQFPTQSSQHFSHLPIIAFLCHNVYPRRPGRGSTEYKMHHYFATTLVGYFIVCKSTTSVTRIFLWRHDETTFCFFDVYRLAHGRNFLFVKKETLIPVDGALTLTRKTILFSC